MNKFKKIGLSALAGTLASLSAQAGEMSVSGTAELTYVQRNNGEITGNPLGQKKNVSFSGSGELDNGWTVSILHVMNDAMSGMSSSSLTLGMGGLGSLSYDSGTGGYGLAAIDNVVPIAFEEADYGFSTGMVDVGSVVTNHGSLHWKAPAIIPNGDIQVSWIPRGNSAATSDGGTSEGSGGRGWSVTGSFTPEMLPGLRIGGGMGEGENYVAGGNDREEETIFATYAFGPMSVGYQWSEDDKNGSTVYTTDVYGVSFNVNDVFSVSYQYGETEYDKTSGTDITAEFEGISAAYNIGPMAIKFTTNEASDYNGTAAKNDENKELNLSMSF